jgi:hypothetical protein
MHVHDDDQLGCQFGKWYLFTYHLRKITVDSGCDQCVIVYDTSTSMIHNSVCTVCVFLFCKISRCAVISGSSFQSLTSAIYFQRNKIHRIWRRMLCSGCVVWCCACAGVVWLEAGSTASVREWRECTCVCTTIYIHDA